MSRNVPLPDRILNTTSLLLTLVMVAQSDAIAPVALDMAKFINDADGLGRGDRDPADLLRHRRPALQPDHGAQPRALAGREDALRPYSGGDQVVARTVDQQPIFRNFVLFNIMARPDRLLTP